MRILYIYKDYKKRRKQYGEYLSQLGHDVVFLENKHKAKEGSLSIRDVKKAKPDVVWFYSPFYIKHNKEFVDYIKSKNIPIILYGQYNPQVPYPEWLDVWKTPDILFVQNKEFHNYLKEQNLNSYYISFGFHPDQYYKTRSSTKYDISFCGTACTSDSAKKDKRAVYIQSLHKYDMHVFGDSFKGKLKNIPVKSYKTHDAQREIYGQTKINLDVPFFQYHPKFYRHKYHIKNRLFEVPATGNFLLTARNDEFLDIFPEDTVGYYDDSIISLEESVKKYLKDKDLRDRMAEKAHKLVYQKHTFLHRFKEMLKIIEG
jgi:hypothetical protein